MLLAQEERFRDLVREVERDRLWRLAEAGRESADSLRRRALAWLGQQLILWGYRLQRRYGAGRSEIGRQSQPQTFVGS